MLKKSCFVKTDFVYFIVKDETYTYLIISSFNEFHILTDLFS